jgi:ligand-binding sensor domain-containing protein/signal transduction histidine kinase/DNA-binding response OmpR family regulator
MYTHRTYIKLISTILLLLLLHFQSAAQKNESNFIHKYTTEQGLSSNTIFGILQDRYGLIWISTEEGLNRFDGKNFTQFAINKGRYALSHNYAQTMLLAPDGNIWAGTPNGLNIYDYKTDSIIQVRKDSKPLKLIYNDITCLAQGVDKNRVWIGTYGDAINYFDNGTKKFYKLQLPTLAHLPQPVNVVSVLEDDNKRLWIGTQHDGIYQYNLETRKLAKYNLSENASTIRTIYQDNFRRIWFGTSEGCYIFNETKQVPERINYPQSLSETSIGAIREDRNGKIWIGTELFLMSFDARSFSLTEKFPFQTILQQKSTSNLDCAFINTMFVDRDNNIWVGTAWGGVTMLGAASPKFKLIKHNPSEATDLPNYSVASLCQDRKGNLWIGIDGSGVYTMNLQSGELSRYPLEEKKYGRYFKVVVIDNDENLWFGTYKNGLLRKKKNSPQIDVFRKGAQKNSLPDNEITCIFESKDKTLWIGTNNGLAKYDKANNQFIRINIPRKLTTILSIAETSDGVLWLGTYGGYVLSYNPKTKALRNNALPFDARIVPDILVYKDSIWIATSGNGLSVYDYKTKKTKTYTETNGLASNYISSLLRDPKGRIWLGTNRGISRLIAKTGEIQNYNTQDGVQALKLAGKSAIKLADGRMAFGGFGGINIFDPLLVDKNDKCPQVVFTKLLVSNTVVNPSNNPKKHSPLQENITLCKRIELNYDQSIFTIEFTGINYNATQKINYSYIVEGTDNRWNNIGNQNTVTLRNLSPGEYCFKVKASSPDNVWSDSNIQSIQILIKPPFWRTWWAYICYLLLITGVIYFVWQYATIRVRTSNHLKIERAKREKEEELHQEKLQFFTNISHEFRTPLTLIISPLEKMHQDEVAEDKKAHLKLMLRNAKRLLNMVNQLLDFRKAERGQMKLKVQHHDLIAAIKEIVISFDELRIQKNIQLDFIYEEEVLLAWFDTEFLNKLLFNLLSNAFKFTPDYGNILVALSTDNDMQGHSVVHMAVSNNGKGIQPDEIDYVFDRFYQGSEQSSIQEGTGIGLHLTKNLVELHHGTIEVESTPNVKTTFTITLPIEKSAYLSSELLDEAQIHPSSDTDENEIGSTEKFVLTTAKTAKEHRKRILIVEDNQDIRSYIHSILAADYIIDEAENGVVGLEMVTLHDFDLIISDLMMPEMDGITMCKQLKSSIETDHIPIVLLTAKSDIENRIEGLSIGADAYITKPFHPNHLIIRVAKLIETRELLKDRFSRRLSLGEAQKAEPNQESTDVLFLQKTISIILNKMAETEFNGDALAAELGISRMGLHRKIKALTDQSTGEFIRNIRLKKAYELLSVPGKNISEVCYDVGFNSPSYFTACFNEVFKMTPSEYVRNFKFKSE